MRTTIRSSRGWRLLPTLALLMALAAGLLPAPSRTYAASTNVFINEFHYDNTGTDSGEFIEVAGPAGTDLTGWSIVLYNGSNGAVYDTDSLSGTIADAGNGFGFVAVNYPSNGIQNGAPDGMALVDNTGAVVQFLSYEGSLTAVGGSANGMTSTDIGMSETGTEIVGLSLQLSGTGSSYEDFIWSGPSANTNGAVNTSQTFTGGPPPPATIDLSTYARIGRYDLPVPARVSAPADSELALEVSAVTYNPVTDTLFVLGDEGTSVVQVSNRGQIIDSMTLAAGDFADTEGLTYVGASNQFALVEERLRQVNLFTYVANGTLARADVQSVKLGTTIGNIGLEGISYDPQTGGYILVKETSPQGIFQTNIDFAAGTATNGSPSTVDSTNLFDPALMGLTDIADVYALSDGNLLVLSQEDGKIVNVDRSGTIASSLSIASDSDNLLTVATQGFEGVTMDGDGLLYIVGEQAGGDGDHPQLWVYAPAAYSYTNAAPVAVSLSGTPISLPENTSTAAPIQVGTIVVSDDALGSNMLSLGGADAAAFEIVGSGLFLKAGTALDFETKPSYVVTVNVDDASVGTTPDASTTFTLEISDTSDTPATLIVSEVAPWSSGNSPGVGADWFELTNVSASAVNISGWRVDDDSASFANSSALGDVSSIAPGQSVVFVDGDAAKVTAFVNTWFGGTLPTGVVIGTYGGPGLGTGGDAVNLFDANGTLVTGVSFGASPSASPFATFDNAAGNPSVSTLSVVGVNGAFSVIDGSVTLIGSPGAISGAPVSVTQVGISATDAAAAEAGQNPGSFSILRTGDTSAALAVSYSLSGSADISDYSPALTGVATIAAGAASVEITITPVDDSLVEVAETVTLTVVDTAEYDVAANASSATVTIDDNDTALADFNLQVSEIWPGNGEGKDLTKDWFEITNSGSEAWVAGVAPALYYDDDSQDPGVADLISGITQIDPGASVVVVIGKAADAQTFADVWGSVINLSGVEIGYTDGAGLGAGGDGVSLFVGLPATGSVPAEYATYPDTVGFAGQSYDVGLTAFSVAGQNGAVATAPNDADEAAVGSPGNGAPIGPAASVNINEFHYDNDGADTGEAVEVRATVGADLSGWSIVLYNGSNGTSYNTTSLSGVVADSGDGFGYIVLSISGIQNGSPDGIALVNAGGEVLEFLSYEGVITAVGGPANGMTSTDVGVAEAGNEPVGQSLQLIEGVWVGPIASTFGAVNAVVEPGQALPLAENFEACPLTGWEIVSVDADTTNTWTCSAQYSNAEANGYGDSAPANEWLITPALDMDAQDNDTLTFRSYTQYSDSGAAYPQLEVVYSTDYAGDPTAATWTQLSGITFSAANSRSWTDSGAIDLSGISGSRVYFAFHYSASGTTSGSAAVWRIDGISFEEDSGPGEPEIVKIHDVQGSGAASPLVGQSVIIEGVVVGDFQNDGDTDSGNLGGFFVQEEDADADANALTSEGIFVYSNVAVNSGDVVRVTGVVAEYYDLTELTSVSAVEIIGTGASVTPATINLPVSAISDFEAFEGMAVSFPQELVISEYYNFSRFGELVLAKPLNGEDRPYNPTAVDLPANAQARKDANALSRITLDDGLTAQNPDVLRHPNGAAFAQDNYFRGGDTVKNAVGVLHYDFNLYRIQPTGPAEYSSVNLRSDEPADVGGRLKVASFNVLNYFLTLDDGVNDICGAEQNLECRGADNADEFTRQETKIVEALLAIDADVVGLIEMENTPGVEPLARLVSQMNAQAGAGTYDFIDTGMIGTDAIRVGFIYQPAAVTLVGDFAVLDSSVDPNFDDTKNRPALAQTFNENATGARFTAVVNHLKSKGSGCGTGDDDLLQGSCNGTRTLAAQALANWLETDPTSSGDADFLILGDLNAYAKEDPIAALEAANYTNLIAQFGGQFAYSYVFNGEFGYLDYALANAPLLSQITGVTEWHINADEANVLDYDTSFKPDPIDALYEPNAFRASDHDPVLVGLNLTVPVAPNVTGFVWDDLNADGLQFNETAKGVAGVTVKLLYRNEEVQTTTTGADGMYAFSSVTTGRSYQVEFVAPADYVFTTPNVNGNGNDGSDSDANRSNGRTPSFRVNTGQTVGDIDAGLLADGSVTGFVWDDRNSDGLQFNESTKGIAGVTVNLRYRNEVVATTVTDGEGKYSFGGLTAWQSYQVEFIAPAGYVFTHANVNDNGNDGSDSDANRSNGRTSSIRTAVSGQTVGDIDAGLVADGSITGFVWNDLNGDGLQFNESTKGIAGVTVNLRYRNEVVATTVTDGEGKYSFGGLTAWQSYQVEFIAPTGYVFTHANVNDNGNDGSDSDANRSNGRTPSIRTEVSGQTVGDIDAGLVADGSITGFVWNDLNGDGLQFNESTKGIAGVTVNLRYRNEVVQTTTTDANGMYSFGGLEAWQSYQIEFAAPDGYVFTKSNVNGNGNDGSDSDANRSNGRAPSFKISVSAQAVSDIDAGLIVE